MPGMLLTSGFVMPAVRFGVTSEFTETPGIVGAIVLIMLLIGFVIAAPATNGLSVVLSALIGVVVSGAIVGVTCGIVASRGLTIVSGLRAIGLTAAKGLMAANGFRASGLTNDPNAAGVQPQMYGLTAASGLIAANGLTAANGLIVASGLTESGFTMNGLAAYGFT